MIKILLLTDYTQESERRFLNGFVKYAEVAEYELAPYGKVRSALVHGPSKALVELYEIVK